MSQATPANTTGRSWYVGIVAGMASYIDAAAIVSTGTALTLYQQSIGLEPGQIGILSGVITFGIAVGAMVGGLLGDRFGRRRIFLATMAAIVLGSALLVFGTGFPLLLAGIVLVGLGVGADLPVSLASIAEAATERNRGTLIVFSHLLWALGILAAIAFGVVAGGWGYLGGQVMFGHVGGVALIVLLLRLTIPESNSWNAAFTEHTNGIPTLRGSKAGLRDLLQPPYLAPLLTLVGFYALTNLGANTGGQFNTYIAVNVAGVPVQTFSLVALGAFPVGILAGLWFMKIVDGRYRLNYFAVGAVLMVASFALLAIAGFTLVTMAIALVIGSVGNAFAFEGIMKVWSQESFPTLLRSSAQGTILAVARLLAGVLAFVTPAIVEVSPQGLYAGLAVITAVGLLIAWFGFRRGASNHFDIEDQRIDEPSAAAPKVATTR